MAKKDTAAAGDNSREITDPVLRARFLQEKLAKVRTLDAEADGYRAQVKALNKNIADEMRDIKTCLSMPRTLVERELWLIDLDDAKRDVAMGQIKEIHRACGIGEQPSFTVVLDGTLKEGKPTVATSADAQFVRVAKAAGRESGRAGKRYVDNPHVAGSDANGAWASGWMDGQRELANEMRVTPPANTPEPAHA